MAKRRNFKPEFRARPTLEDLTDVKTVAETWREHQREHLSSLAGKPIL